MPVTAQDTRSSDNTIVVSGEYQRDWDRGNKREAEGLRDMEKARSKLIEYSADLVSAQDAQESSRSRAQNARQMFNNLRARAEITNPDEARSWAQDLAGAAEDWEKYDDRVDNGADDLERAARRQASAQEDVEKAQAKIDEGRTMMMEAQRASAMQNNRR